MAAIRRDSWRTFLLCLILGTLVFIDTLRYPEVQGQGFGQGPGFYPQVLGGALILLGILSILLDLVHNFSAEVSTEASPFTPEGKRYAPVVLLLALSIVLISLMKYLGFFVAGFLLTSLTVLIIRRPVELKHLGLDLLFSAGIIVLVYLVFEVFVGIQLPSSIFFD
jgi:hypothetical protein